MQNQTQIKRLLKKTIDLLEDLKALKVKVIDIENRSSIADFMIIAEGTSRDLLKNTKAISHYFGSEFSYN